MFTRLLSASVAGMIITSGLLYSMHTLIEMTVVEGPNLPSGPAVIWDKPRKERPVEPEPPVKPVYTPPVPTPATPRTTSSTTIPILVPRSGPQTPQIDNGLGPGGPAVLDGGLMIIVAVQPVYPVSALNRALEGYVDVVFDVTAMGTVTNARVLRSSSRLFHGAALDAAERFRFKPKTVDGVPLAVSGVLRRFSFSLEENR